MALVLAADMGVKSQVGGQGTAEAAAWCYNLIFFFFGGGSGGECNFELSM